MEPLKLHLALQALGQDVVGCDSNGNVQGNDLDQTLISLVVAAIDTSITSNEHFALQSYITLEQWNAYLNQLKDPIRKQRAERYKETTDSLFMKCFETSEGAVEVVIDNITFRLPQSEKIALWEAAKNTIRAELPYPDEE